MTRDVEGRGADADLRRVFHGLLERQARCIPIDPSANAFMEDPATKSRLSAATDHTAMKPGPSRCGAAKADRPPSFGRVPA